MTTSIIFGLICVLGALVFIFFSIDELQLGKYSSKLIASIFTLIAYYLIATNAVFSTVISAISFGWIKWTIPIILGLFIIFMGFSVWQNRKEETRSIMEASWKLTVVIVLIIAARFFFG